MRQQSPHRPLRADAERTVMAILTAAEKVLSSHPAATMEQIAEAAGVARTTVHRRFATREALVDALTAWATRQFHEAVESAHPASAPPLVALYQVTANVLRVKTSWGFAMSRTGTASDDPEVARVHAEVLDECHRLFVRAREAGVVHPDTDLVWARRVYYALIHEAALHRADDSDDGTDIDGAATLVVDTLLRGIGTGGGGGAFRP
ncbi:TetR family transcriptional regulator [Streptomyces sp. 150FB]|uniref:TetR/AcrR family transcriptional regulator n=1 Tax=Streptomyces sp. 150FB TaxID=1576605 RepID=UPI0005896D35|nr:TetR/AcrR family transcriptional regulator [Streptomyces sp. 150FB]KIF74158.1 TetR family transcriptional regulator [Streptomyces sp. 150FB]